MFFPLQLSLECEILNFIFVLMLMSCYPFPYPHCFLCYFASHWTLSFFFYLRSGYLWRHSKVHRWIQFNSYFIYLFPLSFILFYFILFFFFIFSSRFSIDHDSPRNSRGWAWKLVFILQGWASLGEWHCFHLS